MIELKLVASVTSLGKRGVEAIAALVGESCALTMKAGDTTPDLPLGEGEGE